MKRIFYIFIICLLALSTAILTGCSNEIEEASDNAVNGDIQSIYSDLKENYVNAGSNKSLIEYVSSWADDNDIKCVRSGSGSLLLTKDGIEGYDSSSAALLTVNYASGTKIETAQTIAIALTSLKNAVNHGDIGLLVSSDPSSSVPEGLKKANIICLGHSKDTAVYSGSASTAKYTYTRALKKARPKGDRAFLITIGGFEGGRSSVTDRPRPNPSIQLAWLISELQSSKLAPEIAEFQAGTSYREYQKSASAIVVVQKDDAQDLISKVNSARTDYKDKYVSAESEMFYSVKSVSLPSSVYSGADTDSVLSLMYTIPHGVYATIDGADSGDPIARTEIGRLVMTGASFTAEVSAMSIDAKTMSAMEHEFSDVSVLNDMSFSVSNRTPLWPYDTKSETAKRMSEAAAEYGFRSETGFTYDKTDAAGIYRKIKNVKVACFYSNIEEGLPAARSVMLFMRNLKD